MHGFVQHRLGVVLVAFTYGDNTVTWELVKLVCEIITNNLDQFTQDLPLDLERK